MNTINIPEQQSLKRIRLAVFIFFFLQGLCFSSWASRIPDIKTSLQLDDAIWGTVLLMITTGQIIGMPISGIVVPKFGSKRILLIAYIGYALMLTGIGAVTGKYGLIAILLIFGFFGNFCNIAVNTQAVVVENLYNRPILASFHGGWSLAGLTGACLGLVMTYFRIPPFFHFSLVAIVTGIGIFFNYKYLQQDKHDASEGSTRELLKKNKPEGFLFLLGITAFCGMAAEGAMVDWNGLYLKEVVGTTEKIAPIGLVAYMLTMTGGRFLVDKVSLLWGRRRILQLAGTCIASGLFLSVIYPNLLVTLLAFMLTGLGTAAIIPTIYSITGQKSKIPTGLALTIVSSISFLGFLVGPPVIGYISYATNLRYSYTLIGILGLCIVLLSSLLKVLRK